MRLGRASTTSLAEHLTGFEAVGLPFDREDGKYPDQVRETERLALARFRAALLIGEEARLQENVKRVKQDFYNGNAAPGALFNAGQRVELLGKMAASAVAYDARVSDDLLETAFPKCVAGFLTRTWTQAPP